MLEVISFIKAALGWIGWLGIGLIPTLVALAVIVFLPPFRNLAIVAAAVWLLAFGAYTYGDSNGADRIQEKWDAAVVAEAEQAAHARDDAEQEPALQPEPVPVAPPTCPDTAPRARNDGVLRSDPHNRLNGRR